MTGYEHGSGEFASIGAVCGHQFGGVRNDTNLAARFRPRAPGWDRFVFHPHGVMMLTPEFPALKFCACLSKSND